MGGFMKYLIWVIGMGLVANAIEAAQPPAEIVIEMTGQPAQNTPGHFIWDKNAQQLERLFKNKKKEDILQTVDSIAAKEQLLKASSGEVYRLIQYGKDTQSYRKFLFSYDDPQTFVACAAQPQDIIALFQRYGINAGMRKADFLAAYPSLEAPREISVEQTVNVIYTLPADMLPVPGKQPVFAVFEQNRLVKLLLGTKELEDYQKTIQPPSKESQPPEPSVQPAPKKTPKPYKALVSGGTVEDRMYMPRVIQKKSGETTNPKNKLSRP